MPVFRPQQHYEDQEEQWNSYVPTWLVETNTKRCVLHAQLQQQLHSVLQTSFGEHEKEIFSKFAIINDMTAADDQQPRPMHKEVRESSQRRNDSSIAHSETIISLGGV
jgi:hypothetical protein